MHEPLISSAGLKNQYGHFQFFGLFLLLLALIVVVGGNERFQYETEVSEKNSH